jgi:hypothetical protein
MKISVLLQLHLNWISKAVQLSDRNRRSTAKEKKHIYIIATERNICTVTKPNINPVYQITF